MNIFASKAVAPTSVDQVLTAFNTMVGDLMTVKTAQNEIAATKAAEAVAAQSAADAASSEAARADSVIRKIEALLA